MGLLPDKTLYPKSMIRPEELPGILRRFTKTGITIHFQILTSLWAELESGRSLYGSETSKTIIAKIEAESARVRKIARLPKPRPEPEAQSRDQRVRFTYPHTDSFMIADTNVEESLSLRLRPVKVQKLESKAGTQRRARQCVRSSQNCEQARKIR